MQNPFFVSNSIICIFLLQLFYVKNKYLIDFKWTQFNRLSLGPFLASIESHRSTPELKGLASLT